MIQPGDPSHRGNGTLAAAQQLLGDADALVVMAGRDGCVQWLNQAAEAVFGADARGLRLDQWVDRFAIQVDGHETGGDGSTPFSRALGGESFSGVILRVSRGRGDTTVWLEGSVRPLTGDDGIHGVIAVLVDITAFRRAHAMIDEERRELNIRHRREKALASVHLAVHKPDERDSVLQQIVKLTELHLPADASSIAIWDAASETLRVEASTGNDRRSRDEGGYTVRRRGGATRWIIDHRHPLAVPDQERDPFRTRDQGNREFTAYAGVPVIGENEVLGVLFALDRQPRRYTQSDLDFLAALASRAALAIAKVRTYDHLRVLNDRLTQHGEQLEAIVEQRTTALRASHARLQAADRLASIGTLTAGLGHDINNVLFPVRCRLDVLDWRTVPSELRRTLQAVSHTVEYLQQLSDGLRLFARDPARVEPGSEATSLAVWWQQVSPLLRKTLPDGVELKAELHPTLPAARVAPHRLTQAVLNLVVNSGEAITPPGTILIRGQRCGDGTGVRISVEDEGEGMNDEVKHRAFDPFFTTKTRGMSTGLGLSLVHGVVKSAGGSIDVDSTPGVGTTISLDFPTAPRAPASPVSKPPAGRLAVLTVEDPRVAAWIDRSLEAAGCRRAAGDAESEEAQLLITEDSSENLVAAEKFVEEQGDRCVIVLGSTSNQWRRLGAVCLESADNLGDVNSAIMTAARDLDEGKHG